MKASRVRVCLLLITCLVAAFALGLKHDSSYANATDTLTFKVGYFGWPASDYIEKKVYTVSEIKNLSSGDLLAYTYYDGTGHRIAIDSARGATLRTLLNNAGIDEGSIDSLAFYTTDSGDGAFATFTMQELMLTERYYFQDLAEYISRDGMYIDRDAKRILWNQALQVDVVLAYEDKWVWYQAETEGAEPVTSGLNTQNRFRLCFGQSNPLDYRTFQSARMVETIYVMFSGSPSIGAEESNIQGKVGSTHQLKITASAADDELASRMLNNMEFISSDTSVVKVDSEGNLEFVGEGDATITVISEGSSTEISVHVGKEKEEEPKPKPEPKKKDEPGNGKGSGKGSSRNGNGRTDGRGRTKSKNTTVKKEEKKETKKEYMYVLSEDAGNKLKSALSVQAPAEQASMKTYQKEMADDAEQLELEKEENNMGRTMGLINGILALEGSLFGFIRFRRQRWK